MSGLWEDDCWLGLYGWVLFAEVDLLDFGVGERIRSATVLFVVGVAFGGLSWLCVSWGVVV